MGNSADELTILIRQGVDVTVHKTGILHEWCSLYLGLITDGYNSQQQLGIFSKRKHFYESTSELHWHVTDLQYILLYITQLIETIILVAS
jgi:hypothetical protein